MWLQVRDVAHQHNFKRQSSGPAYAFIRYDRESSVSKALRTPTLTFKERTIELRPRRFRPGDKDARPSSAPANAASGRGGTGGGSGAQLVGPHALPDDDDAAETPVPPATVYVTSISWETELPVIKDYFEQFGRIALKSDGGDCITFKENFVTSSAGKKRHCGVLIQFENEASAESSTNGKQSIPAEIEGRSIKVWRPIGRDLDQEWASLASISSQIRLLVENSGRDSVALDDIPRLYAKMFGKPLQSTDYSFPTLPHLIYCMSPMGGGLSLEQTSGSSSAMRVRLAAKAKPTKGTPERKGAKRSTKDGGGHAVNALPQGKPSKSSSRSAAKPPAVAPKSPSVADFISAQQQQTAPKSPQKAAAGPAANTLMWKQLNVQQKAAATALEWSQKTWDGGKSVPACEHLWSGLTDLQQKMAAVIGYSARTWDAEVPEMSATQQAKKAAEAATVAVAEPVFIDSATQKRMDKQRRAVRFESLFRSPSPVPPLVFLCLRGDFR